MRELYASQLVAQGVLSSEQAKEMQDAATARITEAHKNVKGGGAEAKLTAHAGARSANEPAPDTAVDRARLLRWSDAVVHTPEASRPTRSWSRSSRSAPRRSTRAGEVDWGLAEALAFASLISDGTPVRLTGQDTERGTFSHRHAVLRDTKTGEKYAPLQHLDGATASFEIYNSPLSEYACLGFEYGYGALLPDALVLWEAQFGDFNNGAQIIIDQFIAAGASKWGQQTRLDAAAAARLRGRRARALQRAAGALPAAQRRGQPAGREPLDERAVLPPAARAGQGQAGPPADRHDAQVPAAQPRRVRHARRARRRARSAR